MRTDFLDHHAIFFENLTYPKLFGWISKFIFLTNHYVYQTGSYVKIQLGTCWYGFGSILAMVIFEDLGWIRSVGSRWSSADADRFFDWLVILFENLTYRKLFR